MTKHTPLILILCLMVNFVAGQPNQLTLIGSSGSSDQSGSFSWSLGEVATQNISIILNSTELTFGFQQGLMPSTSIISNSATIIPLNVYPTPFTNELNIEITTNKDYSISLLSSLGQTIIKLPSVKSSTKLDLSNIAIGRYILNVTNTSETELSQHFNIIKE